VWLLSTLPVSAATVAEDFTTDPITDGWQMFGNTNLFHWNAANQNLEVTWDSSQTNSYFYLPLGTILAREDSFHLSFDLEFQDYAYGTTAGKNSTFPACIGFLNMVNAKQTNFSRGSGVSSTYGPKNLVEFSFFPAYSTYLPTIAQVIVSTNNSWLYNHNNLLDMTPGQLFHIDMDYIGSTRTLTTTVTNNGVRYGVAQMITVPTNFDFRVASVSVSSYSDQHAGGSILAHGTIDNISLTVPPPPIQNLRGSLTNAVWQMAFTGRTNWTYTLEAAADFQTWSNIASTNLINITNCVLQDMNPSTGRSFYRVRAERP
jgi:hypothetical protein